MFDLREALSPPLSADRARESQDSVRAEQEERGCAFEKPRHRVQYLSGEGPLEVFCGGAKVWIDVRM